MLRPDDGSGPALLVQHSSCAGLAQYFSTFRHLPTCCPAGIMRLVRESSHTLNELTLQIQVRSLGSLSAFDTTPCCLCWSGRDRPMLAGGESKADNSVVLASRCRGFWPCSTCWC